MKTTLKRSSSLVIGAEGSNPEEKDER